MASVSDGDSFRWPASPRCTASLDQQRIAAWVSLDQCLRTGFRARQTARTVRATSSVLPAPPWMAQADRCFIACTESPRNAAETASPVDRSPVRSASTPVRKGRRSAQPRTTRSKSPERSPTPPPVAAPTVEKDRRTASGKPPSRSSRDRQSHPEAVAAAPRTAQKSMTINTDAPTSR